MIQKDFTKAKHMSLLIEDLKVHPTVQRALRPAWAKTIRDNFDPDKFGELHVIEIDGEYFIFDGAHRHFAAREALGANQRVPCKVFRGMSEARQAELFLGINNSRGVRALDKFKVAVIAGRETETRIMAVLEAAGLRVDEARAKGAVRAPAALVKVFERSGEDILQRTLIVIKEAWGSDPDAYDGILIRAIGLLLHHFPKTVRDADLSRKLAKAGGPNHMLGAARDLSRTMGISLERAGADWLLNLYNKSRRTGHLSFNGDMR